MTLNTPRHNGHAVADLARVPHHIADQLWRALGHVNVDDSDAAFSDDDVCALKLATQGLAALSPPDQAKAVKLIVQQARTFSLLLAEIAEAEIGFHREFELIGHGIGPQRGTLDSNLDWLVAYILRRHLDTFRRRPSRACADNPDLAVGFTDLVGFTDFTTTVGQDQLVDLITDFQSHTFDTITESGARAVKLIGDAVMYVADSPSALLDAAQAISAHTEWSRPPMRTGLAFGPAVTHAGDYFGPAVNLANRLAGAAEPNQILVDESLALRVDPDRTRLTPVPPIDLKGLGITKAFEPVRCSQVTI
ncbi:adenylate/guanylate cyclase domain-containing protein [Mycobacterium sp. DL440]|uniref:adenylate/guanylate cyclase domain-containing protein n=1 Tax=Mycobacterium sp. DL440 TaxID=2675523 RepID=UPI00141ED9D0|nr:adenylate/guanylate cyclase domain-containing protein [Mycobacterium sp. DL440]